MLYKVYEIHPINVGGCVDILFYLYHLDHLMVIPVSAPGDLISIYRV